MPTSSSKFWTLFTLLMFLLFLIGTYITTFNTPFLFLPAPFEPEEIEIGHPPDAPPGEDVYVAGNLVFTYPEEYGIWAYEGNIFITNPQLTESPNSEASAFYTKFTIYGYDRFADMSLSSRIETLSKWPDFTQQETRIWNRPTTIVKVYDELSDYTYTYYLFEGENALYELKAGKNEEALTYEILQSINFL